MSSGRDVKFDAYLHLIRSRKGSCICLRSALISDLLLDHYLLARGHHSTIGAQFLLPWFWIDIYDTM